MAVNPIRFRKGVSLGQPDAEMDDDFLQNCFVDSGDFELARDLNHRGSFILGRTGSGKTALLKEVIRQEQAAIEIKPENLAFNHIANSNVIKFFEATGVNLEPFYKLLWQHIFVTEIIKHKYKINNDEKQRDFFALISSRFFRDKTKERAIAYLREWGDEFWIKTEYRTQEVTKKIEKSLLGKANIGGNDARISAGAEGVKRLTDEEKITIHHRGQEVVAGIQIKELNDLIDLLESDILSDQDRYYICLDRLDEDWVEDHVRFKLIKSLMETVRTFARVKRAKILVTMRTDLYFTFLNQIRSSGFQEEKYKPMLLQLRWSKEQIIRVLDRRVDYLARKAYTKEGVKLTDIVASNQMDRGTIIEYILDRTFHRPREAIIFLNECLDESENEVRITATKVRSVENKYSRQRIRSLLDEWRREYPNLRSYIKILDNRGVDFPISSITAEQINFFCETFCSDDKTTEDRIYKVAMECYVDSVPTSTLRNILISILYQVGFIGIKQAPHMAREWSFSDDPIVDPALISDDAHIYIHRTFWAALGISNRK